MRRVLRVPNGGRPVERKLDLLLQELPMTSEALPQEAYAPRMEMHWAAAVGAGAVAGLIAGIVMMSIAAVRSFAVTLGFWFPFKQIAATYMDVDALIAGGGAVTLGIILHLIASAVLGGLFGLAGGSRIPWYGALFWGVLFGILVWAVMTFLGLPLLNAPMSERVALISGWWFVYHLIFGALLFMAPLFYRLMAPHAWTHTP
jgi:hypothetical protein